MIKTAIKATAVSLPLLGAVLAPEALNLPPCNTYCTRGVCGSCNDDGDLSNCYVYNGCGHKYPVPYVQPQVEMSLAPGPAPAACFESELTSSQADADVSTSITSQG